MAAHCDYVFCVENGQPLSQDDEEPIGTNEADEFKSCSDGWYWQHRRIHSSEDSLGEAFGPLQGPFETEDEALAHMVEHPELGMARL